MSKGEMPQVCYAIIGPDGKYLFDWGFYGNEKAIKLYTKSGAYDHIKTYYPNGGFKIKKMRV